MGLKRKFKTLTLATAAGAIGAYLFDPNRGRQRRERVADRVERAVNELTHAKEQTANVAAAVDDAVSGNGEGTDYLDPDSSPPNADVVAESLADRPVSKPDADYEPTPNPVVPGRGPA